MEDVRPEIFVFGSNSAGRHGKGAALYAKLNRGAKQWQGEGLQGSSYAIPTKDEWLRTRGLVEIEKSVRVFLEFANSHPELKFEVTPIGCGLAGYNASQIKPMFNEMPINCRFSDSWSEHED